MKTITRFALAHRRLVALAWIVLTILGALTASATTGRLTHSFATPGNPGYDTNVRIMKSFGIDGNEQPTIAVLHLPAGGHTPIEGTVVRSYRAPAALRSVVPTGFGLRIEKHFPEYDEISPPA